jgi:hypothetical protein
MRTLIVICVLMAGALRGGEPASPRLLTLRLDESPAALERVFRERPSVLAEPAFRVLQFHDLALSDSKPAGEEYEWVFFYDEASVLQSVTWNSAAPVAASVLFPPDEREVISASGSKATVFLRTLPGGRTLLAYVDSPADTQIRQVVLLRTASIGRFFPWLPAARNRAGAAHRRSGLPAALAVKGLTDRH